MPVDRASASAQLDALRIQAANLTIGQRLQAEHSVADQSWYSAYYATGAASHPLTHFAGWWCVGDAAPSYDCIHSSQLGKS